MTVADRAAIIGLGLIGGSLARDLAARGVRVSAYDADASHLDAALKDGIIDAALDATLAGARDADVVVLATPVDAAVQALRLVDAASTKARLITDVGSTKAAIVGAAGALALGDRFVGAHPLTGDHRSGWHASRRDLFRGARVYLCPASRAAAEAIETAAEFWAELGAQPLLVDATAHDRKLAWTSHLPHVVSAALALTLAREDVRRSELGPGGRDVTRLAGSSPQMWTAIARENAGAIESALAEAEREIAGFRAAIERADPDELEVLFRAAKEWFDE